MYVKRGCGRNADSSTRDVKSTHDRASGRRGIDQLVAVEAAVLLCERSLRRSASDRTAERVRDGTDENFTICSSRQSGQDEAMRRASSAIT
jgi:hypothetical protein